MRIYVHRSGNMANRELLAIPNDKPPVFPEFKALPRETPRDKAERWNQEFPALQVSQDQFILDYVTWALAAAVTAGYEAKPSLQVSLIEHHFQDILRPLCAARHLAYLVARSKAPPNPRDASSYAVEVEYAIVLTSKKFTLVSEGQQ